MNQVSLSKDSTDEDYLLSNLSRMCEQIHEIVMKNGKLFRSVMDSQFVQNNMVPQIGTVYLCIQENKKLKRLDEQNNQK